MIFLDFKTSPAFIVHKANLASHLSQAHISIVMTKNETVFSTTGQETVGFNGSLGHQVVDHHPDITITALQNQFRLALDFQSRIDTRDNPLACCLFVT
ncbi:Uncharacterised protein [Streptococcus pneumoniae]|nr:Uncharacterised protein [Streptococcus pneumoniae]CIV68834.1 Uncharacterised protein [Streptococcus pneumoniae]